MNWIDHRETEPGRWISGKRRLISVSGSRRASASRGESLWSAVRRPIPHEPRAGFARDWRPNFAGTVPRSSFRRANPRFGALSRAVAPAPRPPAQPAPGARMARLSPAPAGARRRPAQRRGGASSGRTLHCPGPGACVASERGTRTPIVSARRAAAGQNAGAARTRSAAVRDAAARARERPQRPELDAVESGAYAVAGRPAIRRGRPTKSAARPDRREARALPEGGEILRGVAEVARRVALAELAAPPADRFAAHRRVFDAAVGVRRANRVRPRGSAIWAAMRPALPDHRNGGAKPDSVGFCLKKRSAAMRTYLRRST
jgi:hypothetical protein